MKVFKLFDFLNLKLIFHSFKECFESYQFENNTTNFTLNKDVVIFYEKYRILENCIANFTVTNDY